MSNDEYEFITYEVPLQAIFDNEITIDDDTGSYTFRVSSSNDPNTKKAVAIIGDRFMRGTFVFADELKKSLSKWNGTLTDFNHMGTTYIQGLFPRSHILYFIGYQDNAQFNDETKELTMDIHIDENTHFGKDINAYINLLAKASKIPNVSVAFFAKRDAITASKLPKSANYKAEGYKKDDLVPYATDIIPMALSIVLEGVCNDKKGCGIKNENSCNCKDNSCDLEKQKKEELIKKYKELKGGI